MNINIIQPDLSYTANEIKKQLEVFKTSGINKIVDKKEKTTYKLLKEKLLKITKLNKKIKSIMSKITNSNIKLDNINKKLILDIKTTL